MAVTLPKVRVCRETSQKKRPGVHSKCRTSNSKNSKLYVKKYRGQGK